MNRTTIRAALLSDWAPTIENTARTLAAVAVWVYVAGLAFGTWLHRLNDQLARHRPPAPTPRSLPVPPAAHPLALLAAELEALPATTLRRLAGVRSKRARKAELVALLLAD